MHPRTISLIAVALTGIVLTVACRSSPEVATLENCPVTIPPQPGFVPPPDWMPDPRPNYGSIWYGDERLWTMLPPLGMTWSERGFGKHFWFSTAFDPSEEPEPALAFTLRQLDGDDVVHQPGPVSHGIRPHGELHEFMIGGAKMPPGCWEVSATYRGATLSFVALVAEAPQP